MGLRKYTPSSSIAILVALLGGCGGGGSGGFFESCTPPPSITSTPPTNALVGEQYVYAITARHLCGGFIPIICGDVDARRLPAGATLQGTQAPYITWTPSPSQAGTNAAFEIATKPDACGGTVAQAWTVHVTPDTTPPSVSSVYPANAATDVPLTASIFANFSEPVDPSSIDSTSFVVAGPAGPIPGSFRVSARNVSFNASTELPPSSNISITLMTAVKDPSGNSLTSNYAWTFTTAANPPTPPPGWSWNSVDAGVEVQWTSIALDPLDHVYIAYQNGEFIGSNQRQGDIKFANNASGSWQTTVVDNVAPTVYSSLSMLINADGTAHIAYYEFGDYEVRHATNASGSWVSETVDPSALGVSTVSISHDAASHLYLAYNEYGHLTYATNATGSWVDQNIGEINVINGAATTCAIANAPSGSVHVAFRDQPAQALKHATNASGVWVSETVDDAGDVGTHVSIASDSAGNMHVSYYDAGDGDLKYATNASGSWVAQPVDSGGDVGRGTGIALDTFGHVHIAYTDVTNHSLKYATNASGSWETQTVDGASYVGGILSSDNGYTSIAIDSTGKVHISYRGDGALKYATNR